MLFIRNLLEFEVEVDNHLLHLAAFVAVVDDGVALERLAQFLDDLVVVSLASSQVIQASFERRRLVGGLGLNRGRGQRLGNRHETDGSMFLGTANGFTQDTGAGSSRVELGKWRDAVMVVITANAAVGHSFSDGDGTGYEVGVIHGGGTAGQFRPGDGTGWSLVGFIDGAGGISVPAGCGVWFASERLLGSFRQGLLARIRLRILEGANRAQRGTIACVILGGAWDRTGSRIVGV